MILIRRICIVCRKCFDFCYEYSDFDVLVAAAANISIELLNLRGAVRSLFFCMQGCMRSVSVDYCFFHAQNVNPCRLMPSVTCGSAETQCQPGSAQTMTSCNTTTFSKISILHYIPNSRCFNLCGYHGLRCVARRRQSVPCSDRTNSSNWLNSVCCTLCGEVAKNEAEKNKK